MVQLDIALFQWINGLSDRSRFADGVLSIIMSDYAIPVSITLIATSLWFAGPKMVRQANQQAVWIAVVAILVANVFVWTVNHFYARPRPFEVLDVNLLFYMARDPSFPSNSVAVVFAMATAISFANRRLGILAYCLSAFMAFARIYGGAHYPLDVLGGWLTGYGSAHLAKTTIHFLNTPILHITRMARRLYIA